MIGGLAISTSGLRHAGQRLEASAHNAANLVTGRAAVLRPTGSERPAQSGVATEASATLEVRAGGDSAGLVGPLAPGSDRTSPHLDGTVEQMTSARYFQALARVVQTQDSMLEPLVDLTA